MTDTQPAALAADHPEQPLDMVGRWYMVDKDGMATLCTDREDAEKEAKDANMAWPHTAPHRAVQLVEVGTSARGLIDAEHAGEELRRQHTRIAELQARIKTMAEEHADELAVAHLDGRMRAAQPASGLDPELGPMLDFANAGEIAFYDYAVAQHCRATLDILDGKDNGAGACNEPWASVRKRLLSIVELHQSSSAAHAGEYPALVCDYCGALTPDPWHSSGMLHGKMSKHIHSCDACWRGAAQPAPVRGTPADLPPLPDPDLRDVGTTPGGIKEFLRGYATEYAKAALAARAPADSVLEDAARLDFLIEQRAYVVSDPDACPGYWLHFFHKETGKCWAQIDEHPTPRAAIDAARKQGANHD